MFIWGRKLRKLLTNLFNHCIWVWYLLFRLSYRSRCNHLRNICQRLSQNHHGGVVKLKQTSFGSTFTANVSIFHPRYRFGNCPCSMKPYSSQIWRIPTINWHRAQLAIVNKSYLQGTQRSSLTSRLLCVWLAVSNAHLPVLSWKPHESVKTRISMAHIKYISKTKTNFSKIPSKLFSGLQNLVIEVNLSRRFSWPLNGTSNSEVINVNLCFHGKVVFYGNNVLLLHLRKVC